MEEYEDDGTWIWVSFAPEYRMIIAHSVGERKQYVADEIVNKIDKRIGSKPLFITDARIRLSDNTVLFGLSPIHEYIMTDTGVKGNKSSDKV